MEKFSGFYGYMIWKGGHNRRDMLWEKIVRLSS